MALSRRMRVACSSACMELLQPDGSSWSDGDCDDALHTLRQPALDVAISCILSSMALRAAARQQRGHGHGGVHWHGVAVGMRHPA